MGSQQNVKKSFQLVKKTHCQKRSS